MVDQQWDYHVTGQAPEVLSPSCSGYFGCACNFQRTSEYLWTLRRLCQGGGHSVACRYHLPGRKLRLRSG
ncbi:hypothetical protein PL79_000455 [Burkholderia sp. USMB20]|nr:hypothetical protein PL79_000455 [Burkholderia sp. USMB20]